MKTVTVVGGTGFLGSRTAEALSRVPGAKVRRASRRGPSALDLERPETFSVLDDSDLVIDLSNATATAPDALIAHCLARGQVVLEATSDRPVVERLFAAHRGGAGPGLLILGGGIFTGVSNLLGRAVARAVPDAASLTFAVASSPYSGAGAGTIDLMVGSLPLPAVSFAGGARRERPLGPGPLLELDRPRPTVATSLAEAPMLHASTGIPEVAAYFAPKPAFLVPAFTAIPAAWRGASWLQGAMRLYFNLLRRLLLRWRASSVEMMAEASGPSGTARRVLVASDGMMAGAWALAASAALLLEAPPERRGACFIDDVLELEAVLGRVDALAGEAVYRELEGARTLRQAG